MTHARHLTPAREAAAARSGGSAQRLHRRYLDSGSGGLATPEPGGQGTEYSLQEHQGLDPQKSTPEQTFSTQGQDNWADAGAHPGGRVRRQFVDLKRLEA
jgi:hypothetical protein